MITNPNLLTPYGSVQKPIIYGIMRALGPTLALYTDELGNPVNIVFRDSFTKEVAGYPSISFKVEGGEITEGNGHNLVSEDGNGNYFFERTYWGALIKVSIESRLALERERMVDYLISGASTFAVLTQTPIVQWAVPEAVQTSLAANGIWLRATQDISVPDPSPGDPRQADVIYRASFTWRCDVSLQSVLAGIPITSVAIASTLSAGNQTRTTNMVVQ